MADFDTDPRALISVDDAHRLISFCRAGRSSYFASRVEVFPRPSMPKVTRLLRRRRLQIAAVALAAAWLWLPRGSVLGLVALAGAVACGRAELGRWKGRKGRRSR